MALPFPNGSFEAAVMALVIFFVPDPAKGVAEMARVVHAGGMVATYAWDILGGGFPLEPVQAEMRGMGLTPVLPPSVGASWMRCGRYGPARASRRSRRERSPCSGRSQISTTSGRSSFCRQACAR
jgi:SAM-dependent methyltransferase